MTTHEWSTAWPITPDASYRAWIQAMHDAILAVGWVQTADTGQLSIATASWPGTANTASGYLMYASDDGLDPIYLKIEPGRGSSTNFIEAWTTLGVGGTDGAGAITTVLAERLNMLSQAATANPSACWATAGDGYFHLVATGVSVQFAIHVERHRVSGAPTDQGLAIFRKPFGQTPSGVVWSPAGSATFSAMPASIPVGTSGGAWNAVGATVSPAPQVGVAFPVALAAPGLTPWTAATMVGVLIGDLGVADYVTAAIESAPQVFKGHAAASRAGSVAPAWVTLSSSSLALVPAVLWEP